jgi:hypothetical protein
MLTDAWEKKKKPEEGALNYLPEAFPESIFSKNKSKSKPRVKKIDSEISEDPFMSHKGAKGMPNFGKVEIAPEKARLKDGQELDLNEEQSKKFIIKNRKLGKNAGAEAEAKYFKDAHGFVQFPDGSRYKGMLVDGNP